VGFVVHQIGVGGFGHKFQSRAGVFTAELSAFFTALRHIAEVIRPPERCLILNEFDHLFIYSFDLEFTEICQHFLKTILRSGPFHFLIRSDRH
jgi:hypothetical protein